MSETIVENNNKKKALGRGLGSLLGGHNSSASSDTSRVQAQPMNNNQGLVTEGKVWQVAVDKLIPGEFQPRQNFRKEALEGLAQSIRAHGILQPITVRKTSQPSKFEIIAGERRWRGR